MKTQEHTAGPWRVTHQTATDNSFVIVAPRESGGIPVGYCGQSFDDDSEIAANASLIAAAPQLLEALELVLDGLGALSNPTGLDGMGLTEMQQKSILDAYRSAKGETL